MGITSQIRNQLSSAMAAQKWSRKTFSRESLSESIKHLMATRTQRFLYLVHHAVYLNPISPYRKLLHHAGCEYGDLEREVRLEGLEGALLRLAGAGVYVTHDEMKGRKPARRGSKSFLFQPAHFNNPLVKTHFGHSTSGSTGKASSVGISFHHYREQLLHTALSAGFHQLTDACVSIWLPFGEWAVSRVLRLDRIGLTPAHWFSQLRFNPWKPRNWKKSAGIFFLWINGCVLPFPRFTSIDHPEIVTNWMMKVLQKKSRVLVVTYPSMAVRLCGVARKRGFRFNGVVMLVAGESISPAKREAIEATGAVCLPLFGATEMGESAEGCLSPCESDDMHLYEHKFICISQKQEAHPDFEVLLFTTLGAATPKILLNADTGDAGVVKKRDCGCPWGLLGFHTHIHSLWSYAKLSIEGMTLPGELIYSILENRMPRLFGGHAGDYQLCTQIDENKGVEYLLSVCPSLGELDADVIRKSFLSALSDSVENQSAVEFLDHARQFRVIRRQAQLSSGGKSLPVMFHRS